MFRIGDFSKLSQVTVKALHLYDELGLLKPARVDPENGYRYYSAEQMSRVNRILVFKNLGFTLEQVAVMLDGSIAPEQIREMLLARRNQLEAHLQSETEKLALVETRLRQIENKGVGIMSQHEVLIKSVEPVTVCAIREVIPNFEAVGGLFERLYKQIADANGRLNGPGIQVYWEEGYKDHDIDVQAAFPVTGGSGLQTTVLPGIEKAACLIHQGAYDKLHVSYEHLGRWIEDNGYEISGHSREVYLKADDHVNNLDECVTEIQIPVIKK